MVVSDYISSFVVCWSHWFHDDFLYFAGSVLLEGKFLFSPVITGCCIKYDGLQLTRDDPRVSRRMNYGAFALMVYGMCVFVFWCVNTFSGQEQRSNTEHQFGIQCISGGAGREPGALDVVAR